MTRCFQCPKISICCSLKNMIVPPFLGQKDIDIIRGSIRFSRYDFISRERLNGIYVDRLKFIKGSCLFFRDARCIIHEVRPFDCQLFPLDIDIQKDKLVWILYALCDLENEIIERMIERAERELLKTFSQRELEAYANYGENMPLYKMKLWKTVREIYIGHE